MESSATTLNIQSTTIVEHNHKPNFGRYVSGCAKCEAKYPDGAPQRKAKTARTPKASAPAGVTMEQIVALLNEHQAQAQSSGNGSGLTMDQLMAFATEMRKPDPEVVAERQATKDRLIQMRKQNAEAARIEIEQKNRRQNSCSHTMPRGERAVFGQSHSDGLFHPICVVCQKEFPPVKLQGEHMQMGVS
jgi:hypothetical protein